MNKIQENERLLRAIQNCNKLPEDWTVEISLDKDIKRAYLVDPEGELVDQDALYDDFTEFPEQIENCIAYAIANNDDYPHPNDEEDEGDE
jgi:hypothetical protein